MHQKSGTAFLKIVQSVFLGIIILVISPAGSDPVAEHLYDIAFGHLHRRDRALGRSDVVIGPVLVMMLVASFVMKPGSGIALCLALEIVRALCAGVIPDTFQKL